MRLEIPFGISSQSFDKCFRINLPRNMPLQRGKCGRSLHGAEECLRKWEKHSILKNLQSCCFGITMDSKTEIAEVAEASLELHDS